jgi:hypothetical protein
MSWRKFPQLQPPLNNIRIATNLVETAYMPET